MFIISARDLEWNSAQDLAAHVITSVQANVSSMKMDIQDVVQTVTQVFPSQPVSYI